MFTTLTETHSVAFVIYMNINSLSISNKGMLNAVSMPYGYPDHHSSAPSKHPESACTPPCPAALRLVPAPPDTGIVFRRMDLDNFEIEAHGRNVARVSYATSLMKKGVLLSTTEHLLAALYACGVDNVYVDIDAIEVPILDGSSQPFIEMLEHAGVRRLRRQRRYLKVLAPAGNCRRRSLHRHLSRGRIPRALPGGLRASVHRPAGDRDARQPRRHSAKGWRARALSAFSTKWSGCAPWT